MPQFLPPSLRLSARRAGMQYAFASILLLPIANLLAQTADFDPEVDAAVQLHFGSHAFAASTASKEAAGLSWTDLSNRQVDAATYWKKLKATGKAIDRTAVIELYRIAGHFSVIHALLENKTISGDDSRAIGQERAKLHTEALNAVAATGKFGKRIGVNDFGSGELNAKSDVDFTLYPGDPDVDGAALVAAYFEQFKKLTGGMDSSSFDLVAHRYEATIPDWRQASSSSEFAAKLRKGTQLLKSNSEAYFLEGAYIDQIMSRSVDPERKTFTWVGENEQGEVVHTKMNVLDAGLPFFYHPEAGQRYAFGIAVGNWHFFHSHNHDTQAQAKYVLRSLDGTKSIIAGTNPGVPFERMTPQAQADLVRELYGSRFDNLAAPARELKLATLLATLQTAARIRERKSQDINTIDAEALKPLIDLERRTWPENIPVDDGTLLDIAQSHLDHYWPRILIENNIQASKGRLLNWLAPEIRPGTTYRSQDRNGKIITIDATPETVKRFQYSAFFELKDAIGLMNESEIANLKRESPHAARDIEILKGIYEQEAISHALKNSGDGPPPAITLQERWTEFQTTRDEAEKRRIQGGGSPSWKIPGRQAWDALSIHETWVQERSVDLLYLLGRGQNLVGLYDYRKSVEHFNQQLINPTTLVAVDYGTSFMKLLDTYVVEGEMNNKVWTAIGMELVSRTPTFGLLMNVFQDPGGTAINLVSTQLIPGYGPLQAGVQFGVEAVRLGGHVIFVPLQHDKILLSYQGYLPPQKGGLFSSGQKQRVESPRPPLLLPIDPGSKLPLEERRAKIYAYFKKIVIDETVNQLPDFDYTEEVVVDFYHQARNNPGDAELQTAARYAAKQFALKEHEVLKTRLRQFVLQWWTATGVFADFDELIGQRTAGLPQEEFRIKLEAQLLKDYYKGKERHIQHELDEEVALRKKVMDAQSEVAAHGYGIKQQYASAAMRANFERNGEAALGAAIDAMPMVKPAIQLWAIPVIDTEAVSANQPPRADSVTAWATIAASEKAHPQPWRIEWRTNTGNRLNAVGTRFKVDATEFAGTKNITITACAYDGSGAKITETSVTIPLQSVSDTVTAQTPTTEEPHTGAKLATHRAGYRYRLISSEVDSETPVIFSRNKAGYAFKSDSVDPDVLTAVHAPVFPAEITLGKPATFTVMAEKRSNSRRKVLESRENRIHRNLPLQPQYQSALHLSITALGQRLKTTADPYAVPQYEDLGVLSFIDCDAPQATAILAANPERSFPCESRAYPGFPLKPKVDYSIDEKIGLAITLEPSGPVVRKANELTYRYQPKIRNLHSDQPVEVNGAAFTCRFSSDELTPESMLRDDQQLKVSIGQLILTYALVTDDSIGRSSVSSYAVPPAISGPPLSPNPEYPKGFNPNAPPAANRAPAIQVPTLVGLSMNEAEAALGRVNLLPQWAAGAPAPDKASEGKVLSQTPKAGARATVGAQVRVEVYSEHIPMMAVPNLIGNHIDVAESKLKQLGLKMALEVGDPAGSKAQQYTVQKQTPAAGKAVEHGAGIKLVVFSEYIPDIRVPQIVGLNVDAAASKLRQQDLGLTLSVGDPAPSAAANGTIQSQTPAAGTVVAINNTVTAVVYSDYLPPPPTTAAAPPSGTPPSQPSAGARPATKSVPQIEVPAHNYFTHRLPLKRGFPEVIKQPASQWKVAGTNLRNCHFEYANERDTSGQWHQKVDLFWQEPGDVLTPADTSLLNSVSRGTLHSGQGGIRMTDTVYLQSPTLNAIARFESPIPTYIFSYHHAETLAASLFKQLEGYAVPRKTSYKPLETLSWPQSLAGLPLGGGSKPVRYRANEQNFVQAENVNSHMLFVRRESAIYSRLIRKGVPSNKPTSGIFGLPADGSELDKTDKVSVYIRWLEKGDPINEATRQFFVGKDALSEDRKYWDSIGAMHYTAHSSKVACSIKFYTSDRTGPQRVGAIKTFAQQIFRQMEGRALDPQEIHR